MFRNIIRNEISSIKIVNRTLKELQPRKTINKDREEMVIEISYKEFQLLDKMNFCRNSV